MLIRPLVLFALLLPAAACGSRDEPTRSPPARAPTTGTVWRSLGTWSDRGSRQTESFDVTTGSLRLTWSTTADDAREPGHFGVSLHSAISGRPLQTIVDTVGAGSDSVRIAIEPHVAYLQIESEGVAWRVTLEEAVAGSARREGGQ